MEGFWEPFGGIQASKTIPGMLAKRRFLKNDENSIQHVISLKIMISMILVQNGASPDPSLGAARSPEDPPGPPLGAQRGPSAKGMAARGPPKLPIQSFYLEKSMASRMETWELGGQFLAPKEPPEAPLGTPWAHMGIHGFRLGRPRGPWGPSRRHFGVCSKRPLSKRRAQMFVKQRILEIPLFLLE